MNVKFYDLATRKKYALTLSYGNKVCLQEEGALTYLGLGGQRCFIANEAGVSELQQAVREVPEKHLLGVLYPDDVYILSRRIYIVITPRGVRYIQPYVSLLRGREVDSIRRFVDVKGPRVELYLMDVSLHVGLGVYFEDVDSVTIVYLAGSDLMAAIANAVETAKEGGMLTAEDAKRLRELIDMYEIRLGELKSAKRT